MTVNRKKIGYKLTKKYKYNKRDLKGIQVDDTICFQQEINGKILSHASRISIWIYKPVYTSKAQPPNVQINKPRNQVNAKVKGGVFIVDELDDITEATASKMLPSYCPNSLKSKPGSAKQKMPKDNDSDD